jgi:tight adherence protein B
MDMQSLIFISFGVIVLVVLLMPDDKMDPDVSKRLTETKEKKFLAKRNEEELFKRIEDNSKKSTADVTELLKDSSEYRLDFLEAVFAKLTITNKIRKLLKLADLKMPVDLFFILSGAGFLPFLLLAMVNASPMLILPGFLGALGPFIYVKMRIKGIAKTFSSNFPDALALIANSLRAGHSLLSSFNMVAADAPYPVNKLFKTVADDITLGRDIRESMEDMCTLLPESQDLRFFVTAVLIQKEIGGNLAEILDTLNNTIRERMKLLGMIKTMTAQASTSGVVLGLAPVFIGGLVSFLNPDYMSVLYNTWPGRIALLSSLVMSGLGFLVIKQITKIQV